MKIEWLDGLQNDFTKAKLTKGVFRKWYKVVHRDGNSYWRHEDGTLLSNRVDKWLDRKRAKTITRENERSREGHWERASKPFKLPVARVVTCTVDGEM